MIGDELRALMLAALAITVLAGQLGCSALAVATCSDRARRSSRLVPEEFAKHRR
jgi:hypothetical protein